MPKTNIVNKPLNPELKEKDINRKLQIYGIYSAFKNGKVPSNKQIDIALNSALESKPFARPSNRLSEDGRIVAQDISNVITSARNLVLVKNQGNLLQEFIWDAEHLQRPDVGTTEKPVQREGAKQDGQQVAEGLKTLGTLLVTNGEFRKLLNDATLLLRDMASDSAQKAANIMRPPEEQLSQIDKPAAENVWHEKPDMSKDAVRSRMKSKTQKDKGVDGTAGTAHTNGAAAQTNGTVNGEVTEEAKTRKNEFTEKTKQFLASKMPKERREQTIWRVKKMIVEIQGHSDFLTGNVTTDQQAIETLLSIAETYTGHTKNLSQQGAGNLKGARDESPGIKKLETNLRILIERCANSTSLDDLFDAINKIYRDADNDPRLREWFRSVNTFIRRCLQEQGFVLQDESNEEWSRLYDEGQYLFRDRYREDTNRVIGEMKFIGEQFDQDPLNKRLSQSLQKLFIDLGTDMQGRVVFKKHLLRDFTNVVLPGIFESLHYIPIPRIEVSDPMVDMVVENLAVETDNLIPNVLEFGSDNYWRWGRKKISNKHDNKVMISATGVQTDLKDVSYYIRKKKGFPRISDSGIMDIYLGGEGFSFRIAGSTSQTHDRQHFIKPEIVDVTIKNLDVKLKKSKHKFLFTMFRPLLFKVMRPAIQKALEKQIRDSFTKGDAFAYDIYMEAQRTREAARADAEDKRSMYAHYIAATRKKMAERKEQAQKKAEATAKRDTKVNMAVTQHDSIFQGISLPGGISTKATEYKELAAKGDRWESPVFGIGSASETTNLPQLPPTTRKPHQIVVGSREDDAAQRRKREEQMYQRDRTAASRDYGEPVGFASQPPTTYPSVPISQPVQPVTHAVPSVPGSALVDETARGERTGGTGTTGMLNGPHTIPGTRAPI
ncbi:conserved hypothetical protein [Uncinocarpus reesii 1704]|uniref:Uncharacterized protein n=1 Tax=Uncinocarpus reesii (strain UAMH 1704) TaxID=336963 RepID=C4JQH5_UNCRE|nr:uncharacterized protein UREG_03320 [Uncinocarpus reesii 1704]EEP78474.1 conserved hypothetical protein [Uncinocarpus reesii 1704]